MTALYADHPELKKQVGSNGREKRLTTSIFSLPVFTDKENITSTVKIWGIINNNVRKYRFIDEKYLDPDSTLHYYKVLIPKSNGSGALGETLSTPIIGTPLVGYTQSFIGIGKFNQKVDCQNAFKYIKSKFCRVMLGTLKVTQDNNKGTWKNVPMQDFTNSSDINWSKAIPEVDEQLYKKYSLAQEEIDFIETNVKEME